METLPKAVFGGIKYVKEVVLGFVFIVNLNDLLRQGDNRLSVDQEEERLLWTQFQSSSDNCLEVYQCQILGH